MRSESDCKRCGWRPGVVEMISPCGCTFIYCEPCANDRPVHPDDAKYSFKEWVPIAKWVERLAMLHQKPRKPLGRHAEVFPGLVEMGVVQAQGPSGWDGSKFKTGPYCGKYGPCPKTWKEIDEARRAAGEYR
ncbi:MAG: hypothetical protein ACYDH4_09520 [Candidatus Cryosericum sp.]